MKKISFQKKNTSVGSNWCFDPILVIFFEKNYSDWIKGKLSKSQIKWTGLFPHKTPNRVENQNLTFYFDLVKIIISQPDSR